MPRLRRPQIALIALVAALAVGYGVDAARGHGPAPVPITTVSPAPTSPTGSPTASPTGSPRGVPGAVALSALPRQAVITVRLIQQGGPFPYDKDGEVFDNNEHRLPPEPHGYYHAYTVVTPGSPDRGARRIITGRDGQYWYTPDHYDTFVRVDVNR